MSAVEERGDAPSSGASEASRAARNRVEDAVGGATEASPWARRAAGAARNRVEDAVEGASEASPWALAHAQEVGRAFEPAPPGRVRIDLLTDPWSVWCWGMEPVRRAVQLRMPTIEFRHLVGGMFPRLPDPAELGFDVERFFTVVQRTSGMPIRVDATKRDRPKSTFPACIHWHAVRLLAPEKEAAYLRALREAVYLDGENVSRPEVAAAVAERVGLDAAEFREALASGEPQREFDQRMQVLQTLKLFAYPTLLVTWQERTARLEGFQSLPGLLSVVEGVTGTVHPALDPPALADVVPAGERVATREVAEVLGVSVEDAYDRLRDAERAGEVAGERHATGDVWRRA